MGERELRTEPLRTTGQTLYERLLNVVVTGIAIIVPFVVTVWVLAMLFEFVGRAFTPMVAVLEFVGVVEFLRSLWIAEFLIELGVYAELFRYVPELVAVLVTLASIVAVGTLAHVRYGDRIVLAVDAALADIPGIGTVYRSFRRVGDAMLESDAENFEDVKVVEYPREGTYIIGFETAESPAAIGDAVGEDELVALFLPFTPNPVMGGYLAHVPADRVYDVDMTIEEGVRTIITSGIATGEDGEATLGNIPGVDPDPDSPAKAD